MANTSGGVLPAINVFSFVQYESQSETSTFTVIFEFAFWKSSTTACQTASSSGAPHIMKLISVGPWEEAPAPHEASSIEAITSRPAINENLLFIFLSF